MLLLLASFSARAGDQFFAVISQDVEVSAAWYSSLLQLEQVNRFHDEENGQYDIRMLKGEGFLLEIMQLADAVERPEGYVRGLFKVGFFVDDLDAFMAALPDTYEPLRQMEDAANRVRFVQYRDPDGNYVQVFQRLD